MNLFCYAIPAPMVSFAFLLAACLPDAFGFADTVAATEPAPHPNVVVFLADDLGWNDVSPPGKPSWSTPNIERLAAQSISFTDAHSSAAICTPTRYALLTGRYNWRSWLKDWVIGARMPLLIGEGRLTLPEMLRREGYTTACIGKWHLGWGRRNDDYLNGITRPGPAETGFDRVFVVPYSHNSGPFMRHYFEDGRVIGLEPGTPLSDPAIYEPTMRQMEETAMRLTEEAVDFIDKNRDRPFFLYFPITNVHTPLTPHPRFQGATESDYGDFTVELDWAVGEILDALERGGVAENTLLIVTSDNGSNEPGSNLPWRGKKSQNFEGGHRVPFFVRWPDRFTGGTKDDRLISLNDIMATVAEILDLELAADEAPDSISFLPALSDQPGGRSRESLVHHSITGLFAIRSGKWKLLDHAGSGDYTEPGKPLGAATVNFDDDGTVMDFSFDFAPPVAGADQPPGQLYDLSMDPGETTNLLKEQPEIAARLRALLEQHCQVPNTRELSRRSLSKEAN